MRIGIFFSQSCFFAFQIRWRKKVTQTLDWFEFFSHPMVTSSLRFATTHYFHVFIDHEYPWFLTSSSFLLWFTSFILLRCFRDDVMKQLPRTSPEILLLVKFNKKLIGFAKRKHHCWLRLREICLSFAHQLPAREKLLENFSEKFSTQPFVTANCCGFGWMNGKSFPPIFRPKNQPQKTAEWIIALSSQRHKGSPGGSPIKNFPTLIEHNCRVKIDIIV